jgi:hypothetical protein
MPRVIVDVGDVLHCYKKAVKGQINQVDPWNLWKGLEIVLEHFRESGHEVIGVIPQRHFPDIPHALRLEIADLVAAPKGFSLELLESVAATAASGGDILSNRNLVDLGLRAWQIHFSFSSQSRFFCFSKPCHQCSGQSEALVRVFPFHPWSITLARMQRLKRSQPAQTKHRGPGGLADAGPRIQKVHGAMHSLPFIRGAKECPRGIAIAAPEAVKMQIL